MQVLVWKALVHCKMWAKSSLKLLHVKHQLSMELSKVLRNNFVGAFSFTNLEI